MEKLESKHFVPYFLYELEVIVPDEDKPCLMCAINSQSIFIDSECDYIFEDVKPIFHPLSDLTKEIEVNGEKFRPILILSEKLYDKEPESFDSFESCIIWVGTMIVNKVQEPKGYDDIPHWAFQDLIKWHFDLFSLIGEGLAIDINTL